MITLCGFAVSNYYNKVKMVLLEKGIPFAEEEVTTGRTDEPVLSASPLGKIPFLRTPQGTLCESEVIVQYLEDAYPDHPALLPADPWQRAKVRELTTFVELHLELVARELYAQAFFGGTVSEGTQNRVRRQLEKNVAGLARLLSPQSPWIAGPTFTSADCAAWVSLPLVAMASKAVLGTDLLAAGGVDWKPYIQRVGQRPSAVTVAADRKTAQAAFLARQR
ncbi:glutathione S-transferase family protein [Ideonella livida]|uniref:Glutathione S-transferase family protein n=1 Tax=Ideonella livida TaxID=2707176 RepID=A0A7C9TL14_9BURK|nr:glutathione S-transferase [Ideonella livida]NDY91963.1 glutathione S-transferase family protein [Ideonella livida]